MFTENKGSSDFTKDTALQFVGSPFIMAVRFSFLPKSNSIFVQYHLRAIRSGMLISRLVPLVL